MQLFIRPSALLIFLLLLKLYLATFSEGGAHKRCLESNSLAFYCGQVEQLIKMDKCKCIILLYYD